MDAGGLDSISAVSYLLIYLCGSMQILNHVFFEQNDVSDLPYLTFSMDPDEEKHILYEKTEVLKSHHGFSRNLFCLRQLLS